MGMFLRTVVVKSKQKTLSSPSRAYLILKVLEGVLKERGFIRDRDY